MACDCITQADALLAGHNTKLGGTIVIPRDGSPGYVTVTLVVEKIASRGRRPVVMAPTYCPFCGVRYVAVPPAASATCEAARSPLPRGPAELLAACDAFNAAHPVGATVRFWTGPREGEGRVGVTRSPAEVFSGHTPAVLILGVLGYVALSHVEGA